MNKLSFLIIPVISLMPLAMNGQSLNLETVIVSNSVALHPMIFDVQKDGKNDQQRSHS